jgi:hypothetical protein
MIIQYHNHIIQFKCIIDFENVEQKGKSLKINIQNGE